MSDSKFELAYASSNLLSEAMPRAIRIGSFLRQPLDSVLASAGAVRVLRVLLRHGGLLPTSRIAREVGMTMQGVRQVLAELTRIGVVRAVGSARLVVYGAADAHPIVAMLDKLFADERQWWLRTRRRLVRAVTHREVLAAWLFGSAARGQDTPMSDLDIAVVLDAPSGAARRIADVLRGRLNKAGEACAFRPSLIAMTLPAFLRAARDESPLWRDLERDAIRLYGPSPSDLMRDNARHAA